MRLNVDNLFRLVVILTLATAALKWAGIDSLLVYAVVGFTAGLIWPTFEFEGDEDADTRLD